jgi:hypothetical protein
VVRAYLSQGKTEEAQEHFEEFAEAARSLYTDIRRQILDLCAGNPQANDEETRVEMILPANSSRAKI